MPFEDRTKQVLNIKGNLLQSFGAGIELGGSWREK
jgi:hypothetical protein